MNFNPYQAPTSAYDGSYTNFGNSGAAVTERTVASLRKTRPWVVLISVLTFVYGGFMVLAGLGIMATEQVGIGIGYIFGAAVSMLPGVALIRYGGAINKLLHGGGVAELEQAMDAQASFWQIAGIFALIGMVLIVLAIIVGIVAGAAFAGAF